MRTPTEIEEKLKPPSLKTLSREGNRSITELGYNLMEDRSTQTEMNDCDRGLKGQAVPSNISSSAAIYKISSELQRSDSLMIVKVCNISGSHFVPAQGVLMFWWLLLHLTC